MEHPKVTLVFPCWHASKHLPHVLEDLQAQTFKDFEAILVNDGDDSQIAVMEEIATKDSRIRIVRLSQNGGVAAARNAGTDAATSQWITYPDPDDRFGPDYVKSLYEAVDGTDVDMACGGFTQYYVKTNNKTYNYISIDHKSEIMDIASAYELMTYASSHNIAWNKLYNIAIMRKFGLRQNTEFKNCEDHEFNMRYFCLVKKVGIVRDCDYIYYYYDADSNSKIYNPLYIQKMYEIIDKSERFHRQIGWSEQRIRQSRKTDLAYAGLRFCYSLFYSQSPLTISTASRKIQTELFNKPEMLNAILERDCGRDRLMHFYQQLIRIGNARLLAISFKMLNLGKRNFGHLYAYVKPLFRGE